MRKKRTKKNTLPTKRRLKGRIFFMGISMCGLLGILGWEVFKITIFKHDTYTRGALANMNQSEKIVEAPRGVIEDRNEKQLAVSLLTYNIILSPYQIVNYVTDEQRPELYNQLAAITGTHPSEIEAAVNQKVANNPNSGYYELAKKIELSEEQLEILDGLGGVTAEKTYLRNYPNGDLAAQVLGFLNHDEEGQYGVEEGYNDYLVGQSGRAYSQVQESKIVTREYQEPKPGDTVKLTIDKVVQEYVETTMKQYIGKYHPSSASCTIMDPNTGEILAMYSYPSFNPNQFNNLSDQLGKSAWAGMGEKNQTLALLNAWKNHGIQFNYEPGSTFKPLLVGMALQEGIISDTDTFDCGGSKQVADRNIPCWKDGGHGHQTLSEALANSCNVAMMNIAEKMDESIFQKYFNEYGFGEKTGIGLAGEEKGILHKSFGPVEKATSSMGQTFLATPIQLITAFSSVINGGYLMEPYVVSEITNTNGITQYKHGSVTRKQVLSTSVANTIRDDLKKVVDEGGTGVQASMPGYSIGGKTGTGQKFIQGTNKRVEDLYAASFMGFAPVDDPKLIALVVFDDLPEHTGAPAAAFKDMMTEIFPYLGVPTRTGISETEEGVKKVPDLSGKDIYEAVATLETQGFKYDVLSSGIKVRDQYPAAGTQWTEGGKVVLYMKTDRPGDLIEVPNLIGMSIEEAKILVGNDFTISGSGQGNISSQIPKAGCKIEKNHKIVVQTKT